jgi:cytolysin (calcineurin-like family phosphatase)
MQRTCVTLALLSVLGCSTSGVDSAAQATTSEASLAAGNYEFQTLTTSGKCMDVNKSGSADGTNIQQWTCNRSGAQSFRLENLANGLSRLVNTPSGKCVDISGAGVNDGTNIQLWTCNGSAAQSFRVEDAGSGRIVLRNPNSNKCVDISGAGTQDGANIQLWTCNGSNAQLFKAVPLTTTTPKLDVTFYVISDTHADPPESYDLRAMARAVNSVAQNGSWPERIGGVTTGFTAGSIGAPRGVVFVGDLMGWGVSPTELLTFRRYFEQGRSAESILFPGYIGLGNHDLDSADRGPELATQYRNEAWAFVDSRHKGAGAPVPVTNFDAASHAYSWDFGGVHFIQTHRFPGDRNYGLQSSLSFVSADLKQHASDGRPVFIFHHYGMDAFGTQERWWTAADRSAYRSALNGYNIAGIVAGHSHGAMQYTWEGLRVFQVNNAKAEINSGNRDGNGSFAIVRITDQKLSVVTCRWLDDSGRYEFVAPFFSGAAKGN